MSPALEARVGNRSRRLFELIMASAIFALGVQLSHTPGEVFKTGGALEPLLFLPALVWTMFYAVFGAIRLTVVIINGFWPLSPDVRWAMSIASLLLVWMPLSSGYWMMLPTTQGFPALILGPIAFVVEANCLFALSALRAGRSSGA